MNVGRNAISKDTPQFTRPKKNVPGKAMRNAVERRLKRTFPDPVAGMGKVANTVQGGRQLFKLLVIHLYIFTLRDNSARATLSAEPITYI